MMPALAGRLQDILELRPIEAYEQARALYEFYVERARESARASDSAHGIAQGDQDIFD